MIVPYHCSLLNHFYDDDEYNQDDDDASGKILDTSLEDDLQATKYFYYMTLVDWPSE